MAILFFLQILGLLLKLWKESGLLSALKVCVVVGGWVVNTNIHYHSSLNRVVLELSRVFINEIRVDLSKFSLVNFGKF